MHPLDNSIWQALTTRQAQFAESYHLARRFPPAVTCLAALSEPVPEGYDSLAHLLATGEVTNLLWEAPLKPPAGWCLVDVVPLFQMIGEDCRTPPPAAELIELTEADVPEMLALAELTRPGPFGRRTRELGLYLGIRQAGRLAAMAGERLRVPGYTEISAVCTHPDFSGRGYARTLMTALITRIHSRAEVPFLHVRAENVRAIELYRRLGFTERALLHMAVLERD